MWARIRAVFRSLFGWMIRGVENPELLLRQLIDDMKAEVPKLNAQVAEVVKHEKMLEMKAERLREQVAALEPKVEAAVKPVPEHKRQVDEARKQLSRAQQAEVEQELVQVMGAFQVGDASETLDRVTEQIDEKLARAQARQEVAAESLDSEVDELELDVADHQSELAYVEYQRQLGLIPDEEAERTMQAVSDTPAVDEGPAIVEQAEEEIETQQE